MSNLPEYFPQPEQFIPERWTKATQGCPVNSKIHHFASLPFGYGRRTCLGRRFAEIELKILLSKVNMETLIFFSMFRLITFCLFLRQNCNTISLTVFLQIFRSYQVEYDGTFNYEVQSTYKPSHNVQFEFHKRREV